VTTPGGVPNLPVGALTLDTIAEKLHDMSPAAMRGRAVDRMPNIFHSSMGGNPMSDYSFFGFFTQLWAGFNSAVANADPADITGPDDLPGLLINFIEDLPIISELVDLTKSIISGDFNAADVVTAIENVFNTLGSMLGLTAPAFDSSAALEWLTENIPVAAGLVDAIMGTYTGDDPALLAIQDIFVPIRALGPDLQAFLDAVANALGHAGIGHTVSEIEAFLGAIPGANIGSTILSSIVPNLDASKITSGTFAAGLLQPVIDAVSQGFGGSTGLGFSALQSFLSGLSFGGISFDDLIGLFSGAAGGLSGSSGLEDIFADITDLLGDPTSLGSGSPGLPGIGSIPLLGGLLSGGNILASIIPSLDASKVTTGTFSAGLIPALAISGITGLSGYLANLNSSGVWSGSLTSAATVGGTAITTLLGNITSGGLFDSGKLSNVTGTIAGSLISALDASKITSGTFADGYLPDLGSLRDAVAQAIYGGSTTGYTAAQVKTALGVIPGGNIASAVAAAIVPSLDASKITTGTFASGLIPAIAISGITSLSGYLTNLTSGGVWSGSLTSSATVGGTAITTLLGNITSGGLFDSGKLSNVTGTIAGSLISALDASKITTGTFSAGLIPALAISAITGLSGYLTNITSGGVWSGSLTSSATVSGTAITSLLANITSGGLFDSGKLSNVTGTISSSLLSAIDASKITTGTLSTGLIPTVTAAMTSGLAAIDNIVNALGIGGSGFANTDVRTALQAQSDTTAANSAAIAALQNTQTQQTNAGISVVTNFSTFANASGAVTGFTEVGGALDVSSGKVVPQGGTYGRIIDTTANHQTLTDYQIVSGVFPQFPAAGFLNISGNNGYNVLIGRANSAGTIYVAAFFGQHDAYIAYINGGSLTTVATTGYSPTYYPGGLYKFHCGTTGNTRIYTLYGNGNPIVTWNDSGNVSAVGASNRYYGAGFYPNGYSGGKLSQLGVVDNSPQAVIGSKFKQYRVATGTATAASVSGGAPAHTLLPNNWYDTTDYISSDYVSTPGTNNKCQPTIPGIYIANIGVHVTNAAGAANQVSGFGVVLYKNGVVYERGQVTFISQANITSGFSISGTFQVDMDGTDYLQPGVYVLGSASKTITLSGEPSGIAAYWEVALINTGTAG
jgi:hypothetical protein